MNREGLTNLAIAIYRQAYNDYKKGKAVMIRKFGDIVPEDVFLKIAGKHDPQNYSDFTHILRYFDAIRFMVTDPHSIYGGMSREKAIELLDNGFNEESTTVMPAI